MYWQVTRKWSDPFHSWQICKWRHRIKSCCSFTAVSAMMIWIWICHYWIFVHLPGHSVLGRLFFLSALCCFLSALILRSFCFPKCKHQLFQRLDAWEILGKQVDIKITFYKITRKYYHKSNVDADFKFTVCYQCIQMCLLNYYIQ